MAALERIYGLGTGVLSFLYLIFVLNSIQMASMLVYPFSRPLFRGINRWCARSIWGLWVLMGELQNKIEVRFTGDRVPQRENALVLPNHQSMADIMVVLCLNWRCGRLGDTKFFVKDVIKYFPGFGWGMKFLDCIFVKRDWAQDKEGVRRLFEKYKAENIPIFLVSFLEGTRLTKAKLEAAQKFAKDRGMMVPERTLVPRTKGFVASLEGLGDHLNAVYDVTIAYPDFTPTLVNCFERKVKRIEVNVRRFEVRELPTSEEGRARWVFERYREKEALLAAFADEQRFPGPEWPERVRVLDWLRPESRRQEMTSAPEI
jgi:1-acyl-sn-glycerol-3-phosphate acyltransferase